MAYLKPQSPIKFQEDHIYPLTTVDQIIMENGQRLSGVGVYLEKPDENEDTTVEGVNADTLGGKLASEYILKDETVESAINANLLGGKEPKYYLQSYNLLDNSNFANLIAQAGLMGNHRNVQYLADRWLVSNNNITVTQMNGYYSITRDSSSKTTIMQRIPENMAGKTLTFAAKVKCTDKVFLEFCRYDDTRISNKSFKNVDGIICYSLKIPDDATDVAVKMYLSYEDPNVPTDIYWLAVYEGEYTAETLPPYVPKGYAVELAECMRYYQQFDGEWLSGTINGSGFCLYTLHLPIEMRVAPSPNYQQNTQYPFNVFGAGEKKLLIEYITPRQRSVNFVINSAENANQCVNSIQALTLSADL